jgi:hypothetical protein
MPGHITLQATSVQKLCECLLTLAAAEGVAVVEITQPVLFERAGVSPRTGARALALLTQAGVVSSGRGSLTILDAHRLSQGARGELAGEGGNVPPPQPRRVAGVASSPPAEGGRVARRAVASSTGGRVAGVASSPPAEAEAQGLRVELAALRVELAALRAELAAVRSSVAVEAVAAPAPTLTPPLDVDALVGRIVDALRVAVIATLPPAEGATLPPTHPTAEGAGVEDATPATLPPSTAPAKPNKGRGSRGTAEGAADLQRLVARCAAQWGERGSLKRAAQLVGGITGDGIGKALKAGRVTPELAGRVRQALAKLDAEG